MPGIYGEAYTFAIGLVDTAGRPNFKAAPTLATGDFKISKDGGALANLATLPVVNPAGSRRVEIALSAAEMTATNVWIECVDAAGTEWDQVVIDFSPEPQYAEPSSAPASTSTLKDKIGWLFMLAKNKRTQSPTTETVYANDGSTPVATSSKTDASSVFTRGKYQ